MNQFFTDADIAAINSDREESAKYKSLDSRYDLFSVASMQYLIANKIFSPQLNKHIESLHDACQHALAVAQLWANEDAIARKNKRKEQNRLYQKKFREKQLEESPEVAKFHQMWKDAIANRAEAKKKWDAYVEHLRLQYLQAKLNSGDQNA